MNPGKYESVNKVNNSWTEKYHMGKILIEQSSEAILRLYVS
jgi:hypothetical protein